MLKQQRLVYTVSHSALGIALYLFYREKVIAFNLEREKMRGHRTRLRENEDFSPW